MRVLVQSRIDLFDRRGGDTIQIEKTAKELRGLGVEVVIDCSANPDLSRYDLVHLFNIDWPAQVHLQAKNTKEQNKPIVFSPIHHSYKEIERYEKEARYGIRRLTNLIFRTRESREKLKEVYRVLTDPKKFSSTLIEFRQGIMNEQRELLEMADLILVQTDAEAKDIKSDFRFSNSNVNGLAIDKFKKVVNGVDSRFVEAGPDWFVKKYGLKDFILSVGRIEPRKNQLAVIEAAKPLGLRGLNPKGLNLVFVGKISWRHPEYALRFLSLVRKYDWVYHIPRIPHEKIDSCFAAAKVHVLASWFETTGLVNLEAALAGAGIVATGQRAREYLKDFACYCDPGNIDSIAEAIRRACGNPPDPKLKEHILKKFTWEIAGRQTLDAYRKVLNES